MTKLARNIVCSYDEKGRIFSLSKYSFARVL
jgi:hypothetical protein